MAYSQDTLPKYSTLNLFANEEFERDAHALLKQFVDEHDSPFCAEAFTQFCLGQGVVPKDLRAFGKIFQQAARQGIIQRSYQPFKREFGHGSLAFGWVRTQAHSGAMACAA
jgi:hypothetical protein